jgi:hypothetical protein
MAPRLGISLTKGLSPQVLAMRADELIEPQHGRVGLVMQPKQILPALRRSVA